MSAVRGLDFFQQISSPSGVAPSGSEQKQASLYGHLSVNGQRFVSGCRLFAVLVTLFWGTSQALPQAQAQEPAADATPAVATPEITVPTAGVAKPKSGGIPQKPIEVLIGLGPFVYPLGLCSIIVIWFSLERLVVLRRGRVIPRPFVRRFFEHLEQGHLDPKSAQELCEASRSPVANVFSHGVKKWGKPSVEVEQAIIDGGERQTSLLRKHIRVLNGVATIAPLLGLLGTVVGMIDSFNSIAVKQAMGKTEDLAAGIGLALLTTAVGLIIAIPALIMYMYFQGRVDGLVMEMDGLAQKLVEMISAEGLQEQSRQAAKTAKAADAKR